MSDDDKPLVERLRWGAWYFDNPHDGKAYASDDPLEAADRIEDLEAQLKTVLDREAETHRRHDAKVEAQAAEIGRLRKAGTKLSGYAGHDDNCEIMLKGVWGDKTPCDCGYEDAWKALRDALGEAE
jgi:hypothetical protein